MSLSDGSVDHTDLLPLFSLTTHLSKDPRARHGDQVLDAFYDVKIAMQNQRVGKPENPVVEQLSRHSGQQDSKSGHGGGD